MRRDASTFFSLHLHLQVVVQGIPRPIRHRRGVPCGRGPPRDCQGSTTTPIVLIQMSATMESQAAQGGTVDIAELHECVVTYIVNPHEFYIATKVTFSFGIT